MRQKKKDNWPKEPWKYYTAGSAKYWTPPQKEKGEMLKAYIILE